MIRYLAKRTGLLWVLLVSLPAIVPVGVQANSFDVSGRFEFETRFFPQSAAFPGQDDSTVSPSVALSPEFRYEWNGERDRLTFIPFARADLDDDERTHADLRALNWTHVGADWDMVLGVGKIFWGVAESRHLVDVINQVDLVENLDEEDRLGQPMANINYFTDYGAFGLYVLPWFRERTFADREARLRGSVPIIVNDPRYESGAEQHHVDFAARWSHAIDDLDFGVAHFHGTGREPVFLAETRNGETVFLPLYEQIDQTSLDLQMTTGPWLLKLEALTRGGQGDRFFAAVGGFEYTITGIMGSRADLGLLAEYHFDGRDDAAPATSFDRDIFVAARYVLNDPESSEVLAGAVIDQSTQGVFLNIEAEHRLAEQWKLELEARVFLNASSSDSVLFGIRRDDHVLLRVSHFF